MRRVGRSRRETLNPGCSTSPAGTFSEAPDGSDGRKTPGGNVKKRDWIPFVSLGVAQAALMLGIAGFGFAHLNARMDRLEARMDRLEARMDRLEERIETRLDGLDRRVSRIEGVLRLRPIEEVAVEPSGAPGNGP